MFICQNNIDDVVNVKLLETSWS